jgi:hypothetical protein
VDAAVGLEEATTYLLMKCALLTDEKLTPSVIESNTDAYEMN